MRRTYHAEQWLPCPVETVFAFFANPQNLPRLMPPWQKARIEEAFLVPPPLDAATPRRAVAAGAGTRLTLSFRPFPLSPIRVPWEAEITGFLWNERFCDRQLRGPFAFWHHCHTVRSETREATPGTLLQDDIEYELPFGKIGELAHLLLAAQLRSTFSFRHKRTAELLKMPGSGVGHAN